MPEQKKRGGRGGRRVNAGRKALRDELKKKSISLCLPPEIIEKLKLWHADGDACDVPIQKIILGILASSLSEKRAGDSAKSDDKNSGEAKSFPDFKSRNSNPEEALGKITRSIIPLYNALRDREKKKVGPLLAKEDKKILEDFYLDVYGPLQTKSTDGALNKTVSDQMAMRKAIYKAWVEKIGDDKICANDVLKLIRDSGNLIRILAEPDQWESQDSQLEYAEYLWEYFVGFWEKAHTSWFLEASGVRRLKFLEDPLKSGGFTDPLDISMLRFTIGEWLIMAFGTSGETIAAGMEKIGVCKYCRKLFYRPRKNKKFCSDNCRKYGYAKKSRTAYRTANTNKTKKRKSLK